MVVRLKDLAQPEEKKKKGLVRLSDLSPGRMDLKDNTPAATVEDNQRAMSAKARQSAEAQQTVRTNGSARKLLSGDLLSKVSRTIKEADRQKQSTFKRLTLKEKQLSPDQTKAPQPVSKFERELNYKKEPPVIRDIHRGLDTFANWVKPATDVAETYYTPGAGISALQAGEQGATALVGRLLPGLGKSAAGKLARATAADVLVGGPASFGQTLAQTQDLGEAAKQGVYGGLAGGVLRPVGVLAKVGIQKGLQTASRPLMEAQGAIDAAARSNLPQTVRRVANKESVRTLAPTIGGSNNVAQQTVNDIDPAPSGSLLDTFRSIRDGGATATHPSVQNEIPIYRTGRENGSWWSESKSYAETGFGSGRGFHQKSLPANARILDMTNDMPQKQIMDMATDEEKAVLTSWKSGENVKRPIYADILKRNGYDGFKMLDEDQTGIHTTYFFSDPEKLISQGKSPQPVHSNETAATGGLYRRSMDTAGADGVNSLTPPSPAASGPARVAEQGMPAQVLERQPLAVKPVQAQNIAKTPIVPGQRRFVTTLQESGKLSDDISRGLNESADRTYQRLSNKSTVANANLRVSQGIDQQEASLAGKTRYTTEDVATGMRLIDELQKSGNTQRAVTIAESLAKQLTEAGQTVQAASIWNRLTPEGALVAATRKVSGINENLLKGQTPVKISDKQADDIMDAARAIQASGASKERAGNVIDITDRMRKGESVSAEDRQALVDFVTDAKRFLKPSDGRPPRPARVPREMADKRVRDRVTSFLEAQEQAAKERLRSKGVQISSTPIDVWADMAYIGALKLAKGTVKFTDFSEQMLREVGESVRPHLKQIYEKSQEILNQSAKKITAQTTSKAERIAENFVKAKEKTLKEDDIKLVRNMAQKVSSLSGEEQRIASQELQGIMNGFEKAGVGRKLAATYYMAMLLRPISQIRNVVGNELLYRLERFSRIIATPIDIVASKITGGPRTVTFKSGPRVWDNYFTTSNDFAKGLIEGGKAGAKGINPEGLASKYEIGGLAFTSKYNPLTYLEKALGATMKGFDYAAYTRATNQRLREMAYLDALNSGVKGADNVREHMMSVMVNMDDEVHNIAKKYGEYATLQDDTLLSRKLTNFRTGTNELIGGNKHFGLGSLILPFAKTPANLLLRGMDYTPIGILKAMNQTYKILRSQTGQADLTRADVISSVSRAIVGSGMGAMAYWLADKGALFGQSNNDSETRKLQQMTGIKDFQINGSAVSRMIHAAATGGDIDEAAKIQMGDTLWGYEWAQPTSMPMAIGSNIYQGTKKKQGAWQTASEAALAGVGTLLDSSVLSGLREAFQVQPNEDNQFKAMAMNLLKQAPGMFTPALARDINTMMDNKIRESYSPNEWDAFLNPTKANIPGLAGKMPQRVNTLGQPQTKMNDIFDVFVSPAARSKYQPTPEAQFVLDLLNETGDTRLAPRAVDKYIKGKDINTGLERKVNLTPEQYVQLQTIVGQETAKRIMQISPNLPTDEKIAGVIKAMDEAGKIGRNELKRGLGIKPTK